MSRYFGLSAVAVATAGLLGCSLPAPNPAAWLAAADSLDAAFAAAFNRGDAAAVAALYADSASVSIGPDGSIAVGRGQIEAGLRPLFATMPGVRLELYERQSRVVGTTVVTWGKSRLLGTVAGQMQVLMEGRFSDVKAQEAGVWRYFADHASVPTPPPPADTAASKG